MKSLGFLMLFLLLSTGAQASTSRVLDGQTITNGSATLTLPTTTDTLTGRATTDTLTNKSLDGGSDTFTNIPAATALTGAVPYANGGTNATSAAAAAANLLGALSGCTTSGYYLQYNGSAYVCAAVPSSAPTITGSAGTPTAISASGGISFSGTNYSNLTFITGSGGPVTVTASPQIAAGTNVGQVLRLVGESATNTVTLQDGTGLSLNGKWVGGLQSSLILQWDGTVWAEQARR